MATKFILHGGFAKGNTSEDNREFYSEILKDAPDDARVLLVFFAKEPDRMESSKKRVLSEFDNVKGDRHISYEIADEVNFMDQVGSADVVYFNGGISTKLFEALEKYEGLEEAFSGKTVAGESGGANVLTSFFYSPYADGVFEGLGIVPIKLIPHYSEDLKDRLVGVGEGLEELHLPEYAFKIFNI